MSSVMIYNHRTISTLCKQIQRQPSKLYRIHELHLKMASKKNEAVHSICGLMKLVDRTYVYIDISNGL